MKIAVLEPGAWGTTLGILLNRKGDETKVSSSLFANVRVNEVSFWYENPELALKIETVKENEKLPGILIPKKIFISSDLGKVIENANLIIIASPSFNFRKTLLKLKKCRGRTPANYPPLLGIAKGIERETLKLPSQIVGEIFGKIPYAHLSGPGFAREIIKGKPAKEVIASKSKKFLKQLKELFKIKPLEISTTADLIGVQLAGALKNALAIGISLVEAEYQNSKMSKDLIRLGLKEMIKLGQKMGAKKETFLGPVGRGDLILTSTSPLSRNFQFGQTLYLDAEKMRKDYNPPTTSSRLRRAPIRERKITVEGFDNVFAFYKLGKIHKLDLPMINEIYKVIYEKTSPEKAVKNLIELANLEE